MDRRRLEELLACGPDNALLRVSLGSVCMQEGQTAEALAHLSRALQLDPEYSAAWKMYARCLNAAGRRDESIEAYRSGIGVAEKRGDMQALREMRVFLRRLEQG